MSTEALTKFVGQLHDDEQLRAELSLSGKTREERIEALVEQGSKRGFGFSKDECVAFLEMGQKMQAGELADAELETVAGGAMDKDEAASKGLDLLLDWFQPDPEPPTGTAVAGVRG